MPRTWGVLALAPFVAMTGCTVLLGDFASTGEVDDAGGDVAVAPPDAAHDAVAVDAQTDAAASDAGASDAVSEDAVVDVVVPDAPVDCTGTTATVTPSGTASYCPGGTVTLTASLAAKYSWSNGETTRSIQVSAVGAYAVTTVDLRGCRAVSQPVTVTAFPAPATPTISATATSFCAGASVTLTGSSAASYKWSTGATTQSTAVTSGGSYTVTTTDGNGCPATSAPFSVTEVTPAHSSATFVPTGSSQSWTAPACVTSINVDAAGGQGGSSNPTYSSAIGGLGGRVQATLAVTPGQVLTLYVGSAGALCTTNNTGATNGYDYGGSALCASATSASYPYGPYPYSGTGGAATDIRTGQGNEPDRILVAGGGGGAGYDYTTATDNGGAGGGLTAGSGSNDTTMGGGAGGSQSTGGAGAYWTGYENVAGGSGSAGYGGNAYCYNDGSTTWTYAPSGGGGGSGWYGGGAGCWIGGGGGSSYVSPTLGSNVVHTAGYQSGDGYLVISW